MENEPPGNIEKESSDNIAKESSDKSEKESSDNKKKQSQGDIEKEPSVNIEKEFSVNLEKEFSDNIEIESLLDNMVHPSIQKEYEDEIPNNQPATCEEIKSKDVNLICPIGKILEVKHFSVYSGNH